MAATYRLSETQFDRAETGDDVVLLNAHRNEMHTLNSTSAVILSACVEAGAGATFNPSAIAASTGLDASIAALGMQQLAAAGLLLRVEASASRFDRRDLLRVAIASAVALPAVASISLGDGAALAATCRPVDSPCAHSFECCSACCRRVGGSPTCKPGQGQCIQ